MRSKEHRKWPSGEIPGWALRMTTQESFMKEAQISFPLIEFVNHVSSRPDTPHQRMTNIQQEGSQPERYKIFPAKKLLGNLQREAGLKKYANETLKFQQI